MVRHVKGHFGASGRHKINAIADALAREHGRKTAEDEASPEHEQ